jgi:hypothetical protein
MSFSSANVLLTGSRLGIFTSTTHSGSGIGCQATTSTSSSILVPSPEHLLTCSSFNDLRWGGSGTGFSLLARGDLSTLPLIGIGDFLEAQWSDLMALYP